MTGRRVFIYIYIYIFHAHACFFALQMRFWEKINKAKHVKYPSVRFSIRAYVKHLCACICLFFLVLIYHSWCRLLHAHQFMICFPATAGGIFVCASVCFRVSRRLKVFPTRYLKSSNTVSITLTLFQFSCRYHIISCPGNKTPNTQATEVIRLQIEMELFVDLLKVFDVFLKPQ